MPKVNFNLLIESIQGTVGGLVFRRYDDEMFISHMPKKSKRPPTKAQKKWRARLRKATKYAKGILKNAEERVHYDKVRRKPRTSVFNLIVSDYLKEPHIHEIDASDYSGSPGDVITIDATDNLAVIAVNVVLTNGDGATIEAGEATIMPDRRWAYTTTEAVPAEATVRIVATATDRPGGTHTHETIWMA